MRWPWRRSRGRHALPAASPARARWASPALPPPVDVVRLGFTDGSEVELGAADPNAMALQAVADVLLRREQV